MRHSISSCVIDLWVQRKFTVRRDWKYWILTVSAWQADPSELPSRDGVLQKYISQVSWPFTRLKKEKWQTSFTPSVILAQLMVWLTHWSLLLRFNALQRLERKTSNLSEKHHHTSRFSISLWVFCQFACFFFLFFTSLAFPVGSQRVLWYPSKANFQGTCCETLCHHHNCHLPLHLWPEKKNRVDLRYRLSTH